jgi:hypothetical protein
VPGLFTVTPSIDNSEVQGGTPAGADVAAVPVTQSFALANNAYEPVYEWTVSGQTDDPLPSFGLVAGSQTYSWHTGGETTQGPAFWFGINPRHLSGWVPSSSHAALGISAFQDAGDTWNPATGGHGLEFNVAWVSPSGATGVAPIEIVGADDETRTVTLALRCGDGSFTSHDSSQYASGITMSDAANNSYLTAGPFANLAHGAVAGGTAPGVQIGQGTAFTNLPYLYGLSPSSMTALFNATGAAGLGALSWSAVSNNDSVTALWQGATSALSTVHSVAGPAVSAVSSLAGLATASVTAAGTGNAAKFQATAPGGTAQFVLNGNSAVSAQMVWQRNGINTWVMEDWGGASLYLTNNSGNAQMVLISGSNVAGAYDTAITYLTSKVMVFGSLAVNNGGSALATTATTGFLYIPTCAGPPIGVPVVVAGAVPLVYDTTNNQLNIYQGGAWRAL